MTYNLQTCGTVRCLVQTDVETEAERKLAETLASKIDATIIRVRDISGKNLTYVMKFKSSKDFC